MTNYLEERLRIVNAGLATVTDDAERQILLDEQQFLLDMLGIGKDITF